MATYTPQEPNTFIPGLDGNDGAWQTLVTNHQGVYHRYGPPIAIGHAPAETSSATYVTTHRIQVPKNADNLPLTAYIIWQSDGTNTADARLTYDGGTGTVSTTAGSLAGAAIQATPTGSGHPREAYLELRVAGGGTANIDSVLFYVGGTTAPSTGVLASGYVTSTAEFYQANEPHSSERVDRLIRGPVFISKDRPAGVVALLDAAQGASRGSLLWSTTGDEIVARQIVPASDGQTRDYLVAAYLDSGSSGTPTMTLTVGPYTVTFTGTGWHTEVVTWGSAVGDSIATVRLSQSGRGAAILTTLQIMREP